MNYTSRETYEFISQQTNDPIVERKTCKVSWTQFPIYQSDLHFYEKISPTFNGKKYHVPTPTLCPEERQRRRLSFRNERKLYNRTCDLTGKLIISLYSPVSPYVVYEQSEWRSDKRNPLDYGREYDFSKPFFQQFDELLRVVPRMSLINTKTENAEYNNSISDSRNCYMNSRVHYDCENIYYSYRVIHNAKNIVDSYNVEMSENGYELLECRDCFNVFYAINASQCSDVYFSYDLKNCHHCILCSNLVNKNYYIYNKPVSKEEYEKELHKFQHGEYTAFLSYRQKFQEMLQKSLRLHLIMEGSEKCIGDNIISCKDVIVSYQCNNSEDAKYAYEITHCKDVQDVVGSGYTQLSYENVAIDKSYSLAFNFWAENIQNAYYNDCCFNGCSNIFWCTGLQNKQYCVLNKQYTKEEYEALVPRIIEHMKETGERGEFFHPSLSPFGYNETVAQEYFPCSKEEALGKGFKRSDFQAPVPQAPTIIEASELPEKVTDFSDEKNDIVVRCEVTKRPFKILKQEIAFYRKHGIPLPRKHLDQRYDERLLLKNPRALHKRTCSICGKEVLSVFSASDEKKVVCEECYRQEVYG